MNPAPPVINTRIPTSVENTPFRNSSTTKTPRTAKRTPSRGGIQLLHHPGGPYPAPRLRPSQVQEADAGHRHHRAQRSLPGRAVSEHQHLEGEGEEGRRGRQDVPNRHAAELDPRGEEERADGAQDADRA